MQKETLIIIGGGATGLMAARKLAGKYDVVVLEAASRVGGRVWSRATSHSPRIIEAGAEFIHGHQRQTLKLLKKAGIDYVPVEGKMYRREKGEWVEQTEMIEGWDLLMKKMKKVEEDMTLHDFLHAYFADDKYEPLRRHATLYAEGFDLADIQRVSVRALFKEWSNEEGSTYRIPSGYGALINFLKHECERKGGRILVNHTVKQIDWDKKGVTVYTSKKEIFRANKLIITVPLNILINAGNKSAIHFTPKLNEYIQAAADIGMGAVIKVVLSFQQRFWPADMGFVFCDQAFPTWWTQLPDESAVLTGWVGGPRANQLATQTDEQILEKAMNALSQVFDKSYDELKAGLVEANVFNWQDDELNLQGYSYDTLKTTAARQLLNTPVAGTIFFAGEALYDGDSPGTVESALVSGRNVAAKLL